MMITKQLIIKSAESKGDRTSGKDRKLVPVFLGAIFLTVFTVLTSIRMLHTFSKYYFV